MKFSCWKTKVSKSETAGVTITKAHDRRPEFSVQETRTRNSHEKLRSYVMHSRMSFFSCEKLVTSWSQLYSVQVSRASFSYEFLGRRTWVVCHGLNSKIIAHKPNYNIWQKKLNGIICLTVLNLELSVSYNALHIIA